jgi:uncharacterized SAM-binding protein YcdF (DUF218 family)
MTDTTRPARIVEDGTNYQLAAMPVDIFTLPSYLVDSVDAIVVLPGQGEWSRLRTAIRAWETNPGVRYLLVAGHTQTEEEYEVLTVDRLADFGLTRREGVIIEAHAWHTAEQADWLARKVEELGITSLALCATAYHLLRAYLAMIMGFIRNHVDWVPMIPLPVPVSPGTISPLNRVPQDTLINGELDRILLYQPKGHVADLSTLQGYLRWMWQTWPPLRDLAAQVS